MTSVNALFQICKDFQNSEKIEKHFKTSAKSWKTLKHLNPREQSRSNGSILTLLSPAPFCRAQRTPQTLSTRHHLHHHHQAKPAYGRQGLAGVSLHASLLCSRLKNDQFGLQTSKCENVGNFGQGSKWPFQFKSNITGDHFFFTKSIYGLLGKMAYIYGRYQVWGVTC